MPLIPAVLTAVATAAVLALPGLPLLLALRLRLLAAAALTAPASIAVITAAAELGHLLHVPWTPVSPLLLGLAVGAVPAGLRAWSERRLTRRPARSWPGAPAPARWPVVTPVGVSSGARHVAAERLAPFFATRRGERVAAFAGLIGGAAILTGRLLTMMGSVDAVTQTYDGIFHLNAVRQILRAHDASAMVVGAMTTAPDAHTFYPSAWHQTTSLIAMLNGGDIVRATDGLILAVCVLVWPLGVVHLVRSSTRAGSLGLFAAGVLSAISVAFPLVPASFGILLPFLLAMSMLPVLIALLIQLLRWDPHTRSGLPPRRALGLLACAGIAVAAAHPQGIMSFIVLGLPILLWAALARLARVGESRRARGAAVATAAFLVLAVAAVIPIWSLARPARSSAGWLPTETTGRAIAQTLTLAAHGASAWWPVGVVLVLAAMVVLTLTRSGWVVASWSWGAYLAIVGLSLRDLDQRYLMTGAWYSDIHRLVAVPAIMAVPLLALGIDAIGRQVAAAPRLAHAALGPIAAVTVVASVLLLVIASPSSIASYREMAAWWRRDGLLTPDERAVLEAVPEKVPPDAVIAVDPWSGGSLASAISDRQVTEVFAVGYRTPADLTIGDRLASYQQDPAVCDALAARGVHYVLDFGPSELWGMTGHSPGIDGVGRDPAASDVLLSSGDARLLQLHPCTRSDGSTW